MEERVIELNHSHIGRFLEYLQYGRHLAKIGVKGWQEMEEKFGDPSKDVTDETRVLIVQAIDSICKSCLPDKKQNCSKPGGTLDGFLEEQWHLQLEVGSTYTIGELTSMYLKWKNSPKS